MSSVPAIAIDDLCLRYGERDVLAGLSLSLAPGRAVTLGGASGCGKSSLLRCLLGLTQPTAGSIRIRGRALDARTVWSLRRHLAYVPQEPDLGAGRVRERLRAPLSYRANRSRREAWSRVATWLERVDLSPGVLDQEVTELSGGERQRLALVGALLLERPILLLDEVTAALDADRRDRVTALVGELSCARLIVTHDPERFGYAERHVRLDSGGGDA